MLCLESLLLYYFADVEAVPVIGIKVIATLNNVTGSVPDAQILNE